MALSLIKVWDWFTTHFLGYTTVREVVVTPLKPEEYFVDLTCEPNHTYFGGRKGSVQFTSHNCDDLLSEQTAVSDNEVGKINAWLGPGLQTRLLPHAGELQIATRWRLDDPIGFLTENNDQLKRPWKIISVPAILNKTTADMLGLKEGGSYWPEMWPLEKFEEIKNSPSMPPTRWAALYMNNPIPEEGSIIKEEDIQDWPHDEPPSCDYVLISMDTAYGTKEQNDPSAYTVWGIFHRKEKLSDGSETHRENMILLGAGEHRLAFPDLCAKTHELYREHKPDALIIEKKSSGQSLIVEMRRRGLPVIEFNPEKDKITRMHTASPFFSNGQIWLPKRYSWAKLLIDQITTFPFSKHDDLADTTSQAIIWMRDYYRFSHQHYEDELDEDEDYSSEGGTYWSAVARRR